MRPDVPASANDVLRQYLATEEPDADPEDLLARLIVDFAQPLVDRVVRRRLSTSSGAHAQDLEDVGSEALGQLVSQLRAMRANPEHSLVIDFESYVAGLASHVAFQFFAARFPERSRLRNRLRYVLTTDSRFRLWRADHGTSVCALARIGATCPIAAPEAIEHCRRAISHRALPPRLPDLVLNILSGIPGAIELGDLTTLAGGLLGIGDGGMPSENLDETIVDPRPPHSRTVELRDSLRTLWGEIRSLPIAQRAALLLNLRSSSGAGVWLFTDLGIVSFHDLAASLGLKAENLAALWNRLPLDDREIAETWGLERQQVINLRSAARQRLARRSKMLDRSTSTGNMLPVHPTK